MEVPCKGQDPLVVSSGTVYAHAAGCGLMQAAFVYKLPIAGPDLRERGAAPALSPRKGACQCYRRAVECSDEAASTSCAGAQFGCDAAVKFLPRVCVGRRNGMLWRNT